MPSDLKPKNLQGVKWGEQKWIASYAAVREFFDKWARGTSQMDGTYDEDVKACYHAPAILFKALTPLLQPGSAILDVACGTGLSGAAFVSAGHILTGVDISAEMANGAAQRGYSEVHRLNAAEDELPWKKKFDALIAVGVLDEWLRSDLSLPQWLPVLKNSAVVGLTLNEKYGRVAAVREILGAAGFSQPQVTLDRGWHHPSYTQERFHYVTATREAHALG